MAITFSYAHAVEADVSADAIWSLYDDVATWPSWDAQAELITREGPFAAGSTGMMKFRDQEPLTYRLTKVQPKREFVDETPLGDIVVRVSHRLEPLVTGRLRITYAVDIDGPKEQTERVGPAITADFPETMASLIALAQQRSA
jgi:Polyketide cyclase / dehydrase and lipid transport